jgi:hypothetical protein
MPPLFLTQTQPLSCSRPTARAALPVLAPELHRARSAKSAGAGHCASQEGDELFLGQLADGHPELAMR